MDAQWMRSFKLVDSVVAQQGLLTYVSNAKLNGSAGLTQVTKHCSDLCGLRGKNCGKQG